jgi:hypothetical protein
MDVKLYSFNAEIATVEQVGFAALRIASQI